MARIFVYDSRAFPDPDARLGPDEVRAHLAQFFLLFGIGQSCGVGCRRRLDRHLR